MALGLKYFIHVGATPFHVLMIVVDVLMIVVAHRILRAT